MKEVRKYQLANLYVQVDLCAEHATKPPAKLPPLVVATAEPTRLGICEACGTRDPWFTLGPPEKCLGIALLGFACHLLVAL